MKGADVVNRFAVKNSFAEQILLGVGNGLAIRIGAGGIGENAREARGGGAGQGDADARLNDAEPRCGACVCGIELPPDSADARWSRPCRRAVPGGNCVSASSVMT